MPLDIPRYASATTSDAALPVAATITPVHVAGKPGQHVRPGPPTEAPAARRGQRAYTRRGRPGFRQLLVLLRPVECRRV